MSRLPVSIECWSFLFSAVYYLNKEKKRINNKLYYFQCRVNWIYVASKTSLRFIKYHPQKMVKIAFKCHQQTLHTSSTLKSSRKGCLEILLQTPSSWTVTSPHSSSKPRNGFSYIFHIRCCGWYNKCRVPSWCSVSMHQVNYSCVHFIWQHRTWKIRWFPHALLPSLLVLYEHCSVLQGHCWASFPCWTRWGAWGINLKKRIRSVRKHAPNAFKLTNSLVEVQCSGCGSTWMHFSLVYLVEKPTRYHALIEQNHPVLCVFRP